MAKNSLVTLAEQSGFRHTGRIDEVERLSAAFAREWPVAVSSFEYGRSVEGRPLRALLVSRSGALNAAEIRARNIPLLMIQAGIHPGESDGKDAGFSVLRDMLDGVLPGSALEKIAVLFVPAFNTDGHERSGRWNRPNQKGPEETGWRTTAQNLNLNRDYIKADAVEMRAMLRLIQTWDPLVMADLHVTDGADFEPDISVQAEPINQGDEHLRPCARQLRDELIAVLNGSGSIALDFYPDLATTDDPTSGFALTVYSPRFSTGYFPQRNRFTVLVETHSWKDYAHRVRVMRNTIAGLADLVAAHGSGWSRLARKADEDASRLGGSELTLDYSASWREPAKAGGAIRERADEGARMIDFRGYAYTRTPSPISGGLVTVYDPTTPQIWRVPLRDQVKPSVVVRLPRGGYLIPVSFANQVAPVLDAHGITYQRVPNAKEKLTVEAFRASAVHFSSAPFEGRMRAAFEGAWSEQVMNFQAGALFVPVAQSLARLVAALLEPLGPDSLAAWGFFNTCFEQKEQMEPYVAEQIAREMLKGSAALRAEFARKLATDSGFAASAVQRLEFFLRRHASWDERYNLYPVARVDGAAAAQ